MYEHTAPQRDQSTLPSRRAQTATQPPPLRRSGPQLVSFHDMGGLYPATMSSQHVHDMQRGMYDTTRGHSFASDDAKPFAYDLGESTLELAPLGDEFTAEERARMSRKAQRRHWRYSKLGAVDSWMRGYNPLCGWFGPHVAVFTVFFFLVFLGVLLYFVVPRVPDVTLKTKDPLAAAGDTSAMDITAQPTGFAMNGTLTVRLDNGDGWIPSRINTLSAEVHYKPAKTKVGSGSLRGKSVPGRKTTELSIPIEFDYHSLNSTGDDTQLAFQNACAHPCTYVLLTQTAACSGRVGGHTYRSARPHDRRSDRHPGRHWHAQVDIRSDKLCMSLGASQLVLNFLIGLAICRWARLASIAQTPRRSNYMCVALGTSARRCTLGSDHYGRVHGEHGRSGRPVLRDGRP